MQIELFPVASPAPERQTPQAILDIAAQFKAQDKLALNLAIKAGIIDQPIDLKQTETRLYCQIWDHYWETIGRPSSKLPRPEPKKETPPKTWSKEAKARERRRRLMQRINKKYSIPSMVEEEYQKRIQDNPKYFIEGEYAYAHE